MVPHRHHHHHRHPQAADSVCCVAWALSQYPSLRFPPPRTFFPSPSPPTPDGFRSFSRNNSVDEPVGQKLLATPRSSKAPPPAARVVEVSTERQSQQQGLTRYASQPEEPVATPMPAKTTDPLESSHEERVLVVGRGVVLTANVTSCDKVIVEGQFQGNIKTGTFILTEGKYLLFLLIGTERYFMTRGKEERKGRDLFAAYSYMYCCCC